jgi:hypothetical protein
VTHQKHALSALLGLALYATPSFATEVSDLTPYDGPDIEAYTQRILRVEECFPSLDPNWMEAILREEMREGLRHCAEMDLILAQRERAAQEDVVILRAFEDLIGDLREGQ